MPDPHGMIAELECRIEHLAGEAEQCRKLEIIAQVSMAAGLLLLTVVALGLLRGDPTIWLLGAAAALGGGVLYGSNRSTLKAVEAAIADNEASRADLIDALNPRHVGSQPQRAADRLS